MKWIKPEKKKSMTTEITAGITTFLTMAYIIFVHPDILSQAGMEKGALIIVTCLITGLSTIATGLFTNTPIAMAPGMGLNGFFVYVLVLNRGITWHTALGIVFISGFFFLILTITGIRKKLVDAIPKELLSAISVGIGIFITFIGLKSMGLIILSEATLVTSGPFSPQTIIAVIVLGIMLLLHAWKVRAALLFGILGGTLISIVTGHVSLPGTFISFQVDISPVFGKLDILGALQWGLAGPIFAMLFVDMFDSIGTILGVAKEADMVSADGTIVKLDRLLIVDAAATMTGAVMGSSTTTAYIESASGISSGGRTGLTAVTTGLLFLFFVPFLPILTIVPSYATGPALVMVGFFMIKNILDIDFKNLETGFPSFLIILMIAFTHSISSGLSFGFMSFTMIQIFSGKFRKISPGLWIITLMCVIFLVLD